MMVTCLLMEECTEQLVHFLLRKRAFRGQASLEERSGGDGDVGAGAPHLLRALTIPSKRHYVVARRDLRHHDLVHDIPPAHQPFFLDDSLEGLWRKHANESLQRVVADWNISARVSASLGQTSIIMPVPGPEPFVQWLS